MNLTAACARFNWATACFVHAVLSQTPRCFLCPDVCLVLDLLAAHAHRHGRFRLRNKYAFFLGSFGLYLA